MKFYLLDKPGKRQVLTLLIALGVMVVAVYVQTANFEFLSFDDDLYVTENINVKNGFNWQGIQWAFSSFHASNWHPLTWLSHMVDCQLFGLESGRHHLVNLFFHLINTFLVFFLLKTLTVKFWRAWLVAALFALHPLHVESVAWVAERKDLLCSFWGLLALISYAKYVQDHKKGWYAGALILFAMGLLSKPMLVSVPIVLLLLDFWPFVRFEKEGFKRLFVEKIPFAVLAAGSCVITYLAQQDGQSIVSAVNHPVASRLGNAVISLAAYLGKMFWPTSLAVFYPYPNSVPLFQVVLSLFLVSGISYGVIRFRKNHPYLLAGWGWYLIMLLPVVGIVQVGEQAMADRYTYLPSIGILIMVIWAGAESGKWLGLHGVKGGAAVAALATCLFLSMQQVSHWQNQYTLFKHTLSVTKNNYVAHYQIGNALVKMNKLAEAEDHFSTSIRIAPSAKAYNNLAYTLERSGDIKKAITNYQLAAQLDPNSIDAHFNLGIIYTRQWQLEGAIRSFGRVLELDPGHVKARQNLARARRLLDAKRNRP